MCRYGRGLLRATRARIWQTNTETRTPNPVHRVVAIPCCKRTLRTSWLGTMNTPVPILLRALCPWYHRGHAISPTSRSWVVRCTGMVICFSIPIPTIYANQEEYDFDVQGVTSDHALLQSTDFCDERDVICAFTHLNIIGAKGQWYGMGSTGWGYCYNLPYKAIAGHIHKQQVCDNVFVLGAAGRLRFSEKDNPADMLVAVGDSLYLKPIDFPRMLRSKVLRRNNRGSVRILRFVSIRRTLILATISSKYTAKSQALIGVL